jgi:hypothetical protein
MEQYEQPEQQLTKPQKDNRWKRWLKRVGIAGFLFFLIKGLLWIAVWLGAGGAILKYCTD